LLLYCRLIIAPCFFLFTHMSTAVFYSLSLHDALPISFDVVLSCLGVMFVPRHQLTADELLWVCRPGGRIALANWTPTGFIGQMRSEEHTSELQSRFDIVCRLLLQKKKK